MSNNDPIPQTKNIQEYLESSETIDWRTPEIVSLAQALVAGADSDVSGGKRVYEWVRDEVSHSADAGRKTVTCRASEVLRHRTGICYAKAHLLAAMLRAEGIPAGFCYQVLRYDESSERLVLHGLNGVFLSGLGRWIRVDCRGNKPGVDAQFSVEREQLAFATNPALGEFNCQFVFVRPLPSVVACLTRFGTVAELMENLPNSLPDDALAAEPQP